MGASQVVGWIDWLRGTGDRPDEEAVTTFLAVELAGRRFLVAAEYFFPYLRPWVLLDELDWPHVPLHWGNSTACASGSGAAWRMCLRWTNGQRSRFLSRYPE
jgi:hypothetical protein